MAKKNYHKRNKKRTWKLIAGVAGIVLAVGVITTLFVKIDRQTTTERIGGEAYSIGAIDTSGVLQDSNASIYLRKAITTDGLKCDLAENATIKYQLFFYDKDGKFLSSTAALTADYNGSDIPEGAESVKIVITPTADDDGKVSLTEVLGYASQLTVTVNR